MSFFPYWWVFTINECFFVIIGDFPFIHCSVCKRCGGAFRQVPCPFRRCCTWSPSTAMPSMNSSRSRLTSGFGWWWWWGGWGWVWWGWGWWWWRRRWRWPHQLSTPFRRGDFLRFLNGQPLWKCSETGWPVGKSGKIVGPTPLRRILRYGYLKDSLVVNWRFGSNWALNWSKLIMDGVAMHSFWRKAAGNPLKLQSSSYWTPKWTDSIHSTRLPEGCSLFITINSGKGFTIMQRFHWSEASGRSRGSIAQRMASGVFPRRTWPILARG